RDGVDNCVDRDSNSFAYFVATQFELCRKTGDEITTADYHTLIGSASVEPIIRVAGGDLDLFGHSFADEQVVPLTRELGNVGVHLVARNADRTCDDDTAQRNDRDFGRATTDVDDHAARGFGDR